MSGAQDKRPVVIATGATGNVGRALVATLAARGFRVAAVARDAKALDRALAAAGDGAAHLALSGVDLLDADAAARAVSETQARFGRLDALAHTVGGFAAAPAETSDAAHWRAMFDLNVLTTLNMVRAALPAMRARKKGSVVAIGAGAALKAPASLAAYAAAKSGVHRLVESFADELKGEGVRINAVLPSVIDTPENRAAMPKAKREKWTTPEEVAAAIAFLLSDEAGGITGALIPVSGRV